MESILQQSIALLTHLVEFVRCWTVLAVHYFRRYKYFWKWTYLCQGRMNQEPIHTYYLRPEGQKSVVRLWSYEFFYKSRGVLIGFLFIWIRLWLGIISKNSWKGVSRSTVKTTSPRKLQFPYCVQSRRLSLMSFTYSEMREKIRAFLRKSVCYQRLEKKFDEFNAKVKRINLSSLLLVPELDPFWAVILLEQKICFSLFHQLTV